MNKLSSAILTILLISPVFLEAQIVELLVLGTVQDAGSPHIACNKDCCQNLFDNPDPSRNVVSLGVLDHTTGAKYLFEASPDMPVQLSFLAKAGADRVDFLPSGIFLTHAHIGHYTGLMYLGREAVNAREIPVYAMPKMKNFLETNGPWNQLVSLSNIQLNLLTENVATQLSGYLSVIPFRVPHRDEYSETVGFKIIGPNKKALFIPDIDKWGKWSRDIREEIKKVDYALLDATFFDAAEINYRDLNEIPHPFVIESMRLLADLPPEEKAKVIFIHFNHTNPLLNDSSEAFRQVENAGFRVARKGTKLTL